MGLLDSKVLNSEDIVNQYLEEFKKEDIGKVFTCIFYDEALERARKIDDKRKKGLKLGKLAGVPIVITDDISTKGILTTAGSKMLENYIPPFDAEIITRLIKEDAIILGKLKINEFNLKPLRLAKSTIGFLPTIIGSETNGHILSLKPSYGLVSRYGLISASSSLSGICISGRHMGDIARILEVIGGHDDKDSASARVENIGYSRESKRGNKSLKLYFPKDLSKDNGKILANPINKLEKLEGEIREIDLKNTQYSSLAYRTLFSGEFASNTARYDGIGFGYRAKDYKDREELYKKSRSESFGKEAKKTIMFGNFIISSRGYERYYKKSQQIRTLIKEDLSANLGDRGFLIMGITKSTDKKEVDNYKTLGYMTGFPTITIKLKDESNEEIELVILSRSFNEEDLLQLGYIIEEELLGRGENNG